MATSPRKPREREFDSVQGPIRFNLEVARYYTEYPLRVHTDFADRDHAAIWRHISRWLDWGDEHDPLPEAEDRRLANAGFAAYREIPEIFDYRRRHGRFPGDLPQVIAEREAGRIVRARQLGVPVENPDSLASADEVRRARLRVV